MSTLNRVDHPSSAQQRKSNVRLALVLASVALVFFAGFVTKIVLFSQ